MGRSTSECTSIILPKKVGIPHQNRDPIQLKKLEEQPKIYSMKKRQHKIQKN